ncbi:arsenate reductase ArsC [uncultured Pseudoteredinibacter sp.]|uniref:arsenate reductase ArsC n=1 Tax=uncultured Pseudoteredinibacter sp. TaxID=1641701 RepID=UPI0026291CB1|nr:arsenate reductase ArsC [uncultured Pseudoteredinibacter sp.]
MNILFVCTHNRCRSILAEAIFSSEAENLSLNVKSAGSQPAGIVHPESLLALRRNNIPSENLQSQSWQDFSQWPCDLIITVCDSAAQESCPHYFSSAQVLHWPLKDPSSIKGSEHDRSKAFDELVALLQSAARAFHKSIDILDAKSAIDCLIEYGAKHRIPSNAAAH